LREGVEPFATRHIWITHHAMDRFAFHIAYSLLPIAVKIDCDVNDAFDGIAWES